MPSPDQALDTAPKSLKRRNFKQLSLSSVAASRPTVVSRIVANDDDLEGSQSIVESRNGGTSAIQIETRSHPADNLASQFSTLELGVEFNLELRMQDIENVAVLGSGNGGTVSKARHIPTDTIMAKKVIHIEKTPAVRKQIVRELHFMHECSSMYIVSYYGAFVNEGDVVMCMEYMDCGSLDRISKTFGPIVEPIIGKITDAVVEGLGYLYDEHKIIHRDVKPSNVLVNSKGEIKLCDFGVSGELINSIADTFVGTSTYMSPERIQGAPYSVKSDVWSIGITLLELAIGKFPFDNSNNPMPVGILDLLQRIVNEPPPTLPDSPEYSQRFRQFINDCLAKEDARPNLKQLLNHPFVINAKRDTVDVEAWAKSVRIDKSS